MKILYATDNFPPPNSGHAEAVINMALEMKNRGHNIIIIAPSTVGFKNYSKKLSDNRIIGLNPGEKTIVNGISVKTFLVLHGKVNFRFLKKNFTISPSASSSIGFIIVLRDKTIMNLGDTIFLPEWENNPPMKHPDILMIPAGGQMTMDPLDAAKFVKVVEPKIVVPCHYRWHILFYKRKVDVSPLRKTCEDKKIVFKEMVPGEKWEI